MTIDIPARFAPLQLPHSQFLQANGPFYARWQDERFVLGLRVEAKHCNSANVCHGGMIATLCDVLLTVGSNIQARQSRFLPTVSMTCDFLAPVAVDTWIEGRLEILRITRGLLFATGLLSTETDGPIARTSGVMKISGDPDPRFAPERYFA